MSIYSYRCPKCNKVSDVEKSMLDPHPKVCPECGYKGVLGRVFVAPSITFRGSGFQQTDKRLNEITDPEYQLTEAEQVEYYDEKLRHGDDRKVRVFT